MNSAETELRGMARWCIERDPYTRFQFGGFHDPEGAIISFMADGLKDADRPGTPLYMVKQVYLRVAELPGGLDAVEQLNKELVYDEPPPVCSEWQARQLVKNANSYLIKRLLGLRKIEDRLIKGGKGNV